MVLLLFLCVRVRVHEDNDDTAAHQPPDDCQQRLGQDSFREEGILQVPRERVVVVVLLLLLCVRVRAHEVNDDATTQLLGSTTTTTNA